MNQRLGCGKPLALGHTIVLPPRALSPVTHLPTRPPCVHFPGSVTAADSIVTVGTGTEFQTSDSGVNFLCVHKLRINLNMSLNTFWGFNVVMMLVSFRLEVW